MTTFQMIFYTLILALGALLPVSVQAPNDFLRVFLDWSTPSVELQAWVGLLTLGVLLFFFRFDWLGIFSALLKTIVNPKSLKSNERILDQQIVLFLLTATFPSILLRLAIINQWIFIPEEFTTHPLFMLIGALVSFGFLHLALRLNKRMRGLNHLRLTDGFLVGLILLLSIHPAFSIILLAWSALAMSHYHSEAILKYSLLIATLLLGFQTLHWFSETNFSQIRNHVGMMNMVVACVLTVAGAWLTLENLQKSVTQNAFDQTIRFFRVVQIPLALGYGVILFLQRG